MINEKRDADYRRIKKANKSYRSTYIKSYCSSNYINSNECDSDESASLLVLPFSNSVAGASFSSISNEFLRSVSRLIPSPF